MNDPNTVVQTASTWATWLTLHQASILGWVLTGIGALVSLAMIVRLFVLAFRAGGWPGLWPVAVTIAEHFIADVRAHKIPDITIDEARDIEGSMLRPGIKPLSKDLPDDAVPVVKQILPIVLACGLMGLSGCGGVAGLNFSKPGTHLSIPLAAGVTAEFSTEQDNVIEANDVTVKHGDTEVHLGHIKAEGSGSAVKRAEVEQINANANAIREQFQGLNTALSQIMPFASAGLSAMTGKPIGATGGVMSVNPNGIIGYNAPSGPTGYSYAPVPAQPTIPPGYRLVPIEPDGPPTPASPASKPAAMKPTTLEAK